MRLGADSVLLGGDVILTVANVELGEPGRAKKIRQRLTDIRRNGSPLHITVLRGGENRAARRQRGF
jgi:hypothetical protein